MTLVQYRYSPGKRFLGSCRQDFWYPLYVPKTTVRGIDIEEMLTEEKSDVLRQVVEIRSSQAVARRFQDSSHDSGATGTKSLDTGKHVP